MIANQNQSGTGFWAMMTEQDERGEGDTENSQFFDDTI